MRAKKGARRRGGSRTPPLGSRVGPDHRPPSSGSQISENPKKNFRRCAPKGKNFFGAARRRKFFFGASRRGARREGGSQTTPPPPLARIKPCLSRAALPPCQQHRGAGSSFLRSCMPSGGIGVVGADGVQLFSLAVYFSLVYRLMVVWSFLECPKPPRPYPFLPPCFHSCPGRSMGLQCASIVRVIHGQHSHCCACRHPLCTRCGWQLLMCWWLLLTSRLLFVWCAVALGQGHLGCVLGRQALAAHDELF